MSNPFDDIIPTNPFDDIIPTKSGQSIFQPTQVGGGVKEEIRQMPSFFQRNIVTPAKYLGRESFLKPAKTFYGGTLLSAANAADTLDYYSDKIAKAIGVPETKNSIFEVLRNNWTYYGDRLKNEGLSKGLMEKIYSGLGEAGWEVPKLMALGGQGLVISGAAEGGKEGGVKSAVTGAITGGLTKGMLKGLGQLPAQLKYPTAFGIGAATTEGGVEEKVASGAIFAGLSVGKSPSMREFKESQKYSPLAKILPYETRENLYMRYVSRVQPIINAEQKAAKEGLSLGAGESPSQRVITYAGINSKVNSILEDKTYRILPDGRYEMTGEGLKPILKNYDKLSLEKNINVREKDLNDYLDAHHTLELNIPKYKGSKETIATPEQVQKARKTLNNLDKKYRVRLEISETSPELQSLAQEAKKYKSVEEFVKEIGVQRIEEPGVEISFNKPQGLHTNPAKFISPHLDLGGKKTEFIIKPNVKEEIIDITGIGEQPSVRGIDTMSTNLVWFRKHFPKETNEFRTLFLKKDFVEIFSKEFPDVNWRKYYDTQEMLEGYAGLKARQKGLDIIRGIDNFNPASSEIVILNKNAVLTKSQLAGIWNQSQEGIPSLDQTATRLYGYQARVLHLLVDSGRMSEQEYQQWRTKYPRYVPFDRVLESIGIEQKIEKPIKGRLPFKRIKGSELEKHDLVENIIKDTYRIVDAADKNIIAQGIAKLGEVLPEISPMKIPIVPIAKSQLKFQIDPKLTSELTKVIDDLKGIYERKVRIGGKRFGYFQPPEKIVTKFGTQEGVIAHELGHYIDRLYNFERQILNFSTEGARSKAEALRFRVLINKELRDLADLRRVRQAYARKGEEKIAALMDAYITKPHILDEVAPNSKQLLENIIAGHEELRPLMKIRPSMEKQYEKTMETIFGQTPFSPKGNVIEYYVGGSRQWLNVTPNIYQAMQSLNESSLNWLAKIMSLPAKTLRTGATITPEFMLRNAIRDQWIAFLQTKLGFRPFVDSAGAIADILGKSDIYYDWLRSGGAQSGFSESSRENLQRTLKDLRERPNILKSLNIITKAQDLSQLFEQATRLGIYKAGIRKGLSPIASGVESREGTLDFVRRGSNMKDINASIAFLNAGIQGLDKSIRIARTDPIGMTIKAISTITIPSMISYLLNHNDSEYQELPRWQKDLFWIFKVNDTFVRIPKPFLYGQVFGSMPERFLEYLETEDPDSFAEFKKTLYDSVSPVSGDPAGGLLATGIKPIIENETNWNFFTERNVVPRSKLGGLGRTTLPEYQYGRYTTETAKKLGKFFKYSPSKIENLMSGYLGGTGKYLLQGGDLAMRLTGKEMPPQRPSELADIPLVRGFVTREVTGETSASVQRFYDESDKILQIHKAYNDFKKENKARDAVNLIKQYPKIKYASVVNILLKEISKIDDLIDKVIASDKPEQQKRVLLEKLDQRKINISIQGNKLLQ